MRIFISILIAVLFLTVSCSDSDDHLLIDDLTYQSVFIEIAIINHLDEKLLGDTTTEELINRVYQHYGVTAEQFRYSHDYFESDISGQLKRMDEILRRLRDERVLVENAAQAHEQERRESLDSLRQRMLNR